MVTHGPAHDPDPGQDASPTTWELFCRFADDPPPVPPGPGDAPRTAQQRLAYHSRFVTVRTPAVVKTLLEVRTLMALGRHQRATARPSLIVTGPPTTGKTTTLLEVGRTCHLAEQARGGPGAAQVPVAYLLVPLTTLGCKINQYDSAVIRSRLEEKHSFVPFDEQADCYIINTCTVTDRAAAVPLRQVASQKAVQRPPSGRTGAFLSDAGYVGFYLAASEPVHKVAP